jgi:hypothetical protein
MTLIAAFRCTEGVVLCADQQETVGAHRAAVNKLTPKRCGEYALAVAGSGDGDLVDGFADSLTTLITGWSPGISDSLARASISGALLDFHANEVNWYPAPADEKLCSFVLAITPRTETSTFLWRIRGTVILPVGDFALIGVNEAMYSHELQRLYRRGFSTNQAILLGIHLFSLAKATSNYVGGNTDIIAVLNNRIYELDAREVRALEERVAAFNERMAALVLAAPDYAMSKPEFGQLFKEFKQQVIKLRSQDLGKGLTLTQCIDWH